MPDRNPFQHPGRFWLPETPDHDVGGFLDAEDNLATVELTEAITPALHETTRIQQDDGSWLVRLGPADHDVAPDPFTVHGLVRGVGKVTLVEVQTGGRQQMLNVLRDTGSQQLLPQFAAIGGHIEGPSTKYMRARFRLRHLDAWAQLRKGIDVEVRADGTLARMVHQPIDTISATTSTTPGTLTLGADTTSPLPSITEVRFTRSAYLKWESAADGLTVDQLWARVLEPVRALLTLAADDDCPITSLAVQQGEGPWLRIIHPGIGSSSDALRSGRDMLVTAPDLGLVGVATWLDKVDHLSPVPQLVAGQLVRSTGQVLESQLFELSIAAEGLHKRIHGGGNASLRQRLVALAALGVDASPGVVGLIQPWAEAVSKARNGFTHMDRARELEIEEYLILRDSLRWLLTALLLVEAGVPTSAAADRLRHRQDYQFFLRRAGRWLPAIYPATAE